MIRKFAALAAVALALAVMPFMAPANAAAYGPKLPTAVHITFVTVKDGKPLEAKLSVSASDGTSPAGTIDYTISRATGAARGARLVARATASTISVNGHAVAVTGPVVSPGSYVVGAHFTPTNTAKYLPSSNVARTGVKGSTINNNSGGGGLSNTGGPDLGWLIAGFALAGAGAGVVLYSRRRVVAAA